MNIECFNKLMNKMKERKKTVIDLREMKLVLQTKNKHQYK